MDKLIKSVSNIKLYYANEEEALGKDELPVSTKTERQECCKTMSECVLSPAVKAATEYPATLGVTLETLLMCCKDAEADVRIAAEESLNRIINGTEELHFSKVLVEFYKEIKRNGSSRSLRAALSRFSNLAHRIRPSKCRPYIVGLIPVFIRICAREDEGVQECLSNSIAKIFSLIGSFASENEVKDLIGALMKNLSHTSAAIRRNSASCIYEVVNNCNKKIAILSTTLTDLLYLFCDTVSESNYALGVITTLRYLVPIIGSKDETHTRRTGSFGSGKSSDHGVPLGSLVVNIVELCARLLSSNDQSVVTSSLETLQAVLKLPCELLKRLLSSHPLPMTEFSKSVAQKLMNEVEDCPLHQADVAQGLLEQASESGSMPLEGSDVSKKPNENDIPVVADELNTRVQRNDTMFNLYCGDCPIYVMARLLCEKILHIGVEKNKNTRVSAKSLAISCIGLILKIRPEVMFLTVSNSSNQPVSDALLFRTFYDPQVRGCVLILIAQYLQAALTTSRGDCNEWIGNKSEALAIDKLIEYICEGMLDESTVCVRASIQSASICLSNLLWTDFAHLGVKLLEQLLQLKNTTYWLVRVDVLDAFSDVNFRQILFPKETSHDITVSNNYDLLSALSQEIMNMAFDALADKDGRVRKAAAGMLVKSVSQKGFVINSVKCDMASSQIAEICSKFSISEATLLPDQSRKPMGKSLLKTYRGFEILNDASYISHNLSAVIDRITELLTFSRSKDLTQGCIQALVLLSAEFSISKHPYSYDCHFFDEPNSGNKKQLTGLLSHLLPLIDCSWPPLEIVAYANALTLAGNYVAGIACHSFQVIGANPKLNTEETLLPTKGTNPEILTSARAFVDPKIGALALRLFLHIAKLLSMFHHIISDSTPAMPNKSVLQTLQSGGSLPGTLKKKDKSDSKESVGDAKTHKKSLSTGKTPTDENEKEKPSKYSHNLIFCFAHSRVHMKLYDMLLGTFETYKTTLDSNEVDKFSLFLRTVLGVFSQLLEIITFEDIERYTEDILLYLKTIFTVEPTMTVQAVQQVLKGLFGTNFVSQLGLEDQLNVKITNPSSLDLQHHKASFYHQAFHRPLNDFTMAIANSSFHHYLQQENAPKATSGWFGSIKKKVEKKLNLTAKRSKGDKVSIQGYIRMFESIVIKSLKNYTMTSSAEFQKCVLNLLAQLVQLRVNYCLLDSDQIFIGFIVKQFESIESGLVRNSTVLIPHVFFFLVLLSYEKHHSKSVIAMPKIIQLCDGIMASGRDTATHVIPALQPIVHDLFVLRAGQRQDTSSDLDTQREVTQSMLFRIIEYPEVLKMVTTILQYYRKENPEQWKKYSRQVTDVLLPKISHLQLRVCSHMDTIFLHSLIEALSPTALRPIDLVLNIFFMLPSDLGTVTSHQQWIVKINTLLRVILCQLKEDFLLQRVQELSIDPVAFSKRVLTITKSGDEDGIEIDDNENARGAEALPLAEEILSKVCLQIVGFTIDRIVAETYDPVIICSKAHDIELLVVLLSEFILSLTYICRSGTFKKVTKAMRGLLNLSLKDVPSQFYSSDTLCSLFQLASPKYPMVSLFWSQFLACVGFMDLTQWGKLTGKVTRVGTRMPVLNSGMVHRGAIIMLADYVCQNQSEVEAMSWLIVNHINEVLTLQSEPPIQDFISVIHRNSAASRLFVESIMTLFTRGERIKTSLKQRLLYCISGLHLKQSDFVVALLLSEDWFVFSPIIAISEFSERLACTRLEMLLVQAVDNRGSPDNGALLTSIYEFQHDLDRCELVPRLGRLVGLAKRLKHLLDSGIDDPISARRPTVNVNPSSPITTGKDWYKSLVNQCLTKNYHFHEVASMLHVLDYEDIMEVFQRDSFNVEKLDECLCFALRDIVEPDGGMARDITDMTSPLLSACLTTLVAHLKSFVHQLPDLDVNFCENLEIPTISVDGNTQISQYWRSIFDIFKIPQNPICIAVLAKSFTSCLMWQKVLNHSFSNLIGLDVYLLKLAICFHQYLIWCAANCKTIDVDVILTCCDFLQQVIGIQGVQDAFFNPTNVLHPGVVTISLHALYQHFTEKMGVSNGESSNLIGSIFSKSKVSPIFIVLKACQLLDKLTNPLLPAVLQRSFEKSMKMVLCHPFFNKLGRVPSLLIKSDVTIDEAKAIADESPANYLSEKDLLQVFISRINAIGWTTRMQFEETWTTLLGVLVSQPIGDISQNATPVDETAIQVSCMTISSLTALVVSASMKPHGGQPWLGVYPNIPRDGARHLPDSKIGHELNVMQCIIENEFVRILLADSLGQSYERYQVSSNCMLVKDSGFIPPDVFRCRLSLNPERIASSPLYYGIGQKSIKSFWVSERISPREDESIQDSSDDESDNLDSSSDRLQTEDTKISEEMTVISSTTPPTPTKSDPFHDAVDTNSCVQFLIDLFSEWFRSASMITPTNQQSSNSPLPLRLPRQFLNECLHSLILVSDFFSDRQQFEWMFNSLNSIQLVQPAEDDLMLQYLVLGMCKSAAILGLTRKSCDILYGMLEAAFVSTVISCQTFALCGALCILETELKDFMKPLVNLISKFVHDKIKSISANIVFNSHQLLRNVLSVGCLLIAKAQLFIPSAHVKDFIHGLISLFASPLFKSISNDLCVLILKSLESLISSYSVSDVDCDAIAKFASERFVDGSSPFWCLSSLNLVVTCLYFHIMRKPKENTTDEDALESRLVSMERISVLFDKMKSGFPYKSRLLVKILPTLMDSFFSTQNMMNKVIGEFASSIHPQPELIAQLLYRVFQLLHARGDSLVVSEWVMLTLRNFTQRTPIWSAIWRLTCIFISASTNHWVHSTMPMVLKEVNMAPEDRNFDLFYVSCQDFYLNQLLTELDKRTFVSTFQSVAEPGNFYQNMLDLLEKLDAAGV